MQTGWNRTTAARRAGWAAHLCCALPALAASAALAQAPRPVAASAPTPATASIAAPASASVTAPAGARLVAQGDRVYDRKTDLTWQRCSLGQTWQAAAGRCQGAPLRLGFAEALQRQADGWRVPTLDELQSIVRPGARPAIDAQAFPDTPPLYFWATDNRDLAAAWYVRFEDGRANHYYPPHTNRDLLRLVHSGRALPGP
jgi:hypothetical protein